MFLTRMALNPARRGTRSLLASPQSMHAAVLAGFAPAAEGSDGGRVLWRIDQGEHHATELFIASPAEPDLTHLVEQAGWPTTQAWTTRDYRPLLGRLEAGQRWAFRLTANPVHGVRKEEGQDTKPVGHVMVEQQQRWLLDRCERLGFRVPDGSHGEPDVLVRDRRTLRFGRQGATVTITQATYDGVLEVDDADTLRGALTNGIGRAKGYGCGLMTLAPLA